MKKETKKYWKFTGDGTLFIPGVPPRDIQIAEAIRKDITHLLEESPLYQLRPIKAQNEEN